ncbi:MAG: hypothetical protein DMG89_23525 [Acidobacteria bacterium]|nr:MAG: hypothetical protein DMG89_23525 [Acidobacteriota bacterium]
MKIRGLTIATVVLAALAGTLYWSNRHKPKETTQASADTPPKILTLKEGDITKVDLKKKPGDSIVLAKDSGGKWQITSPQTLGADQSSVSSMVSTLSSLSSDRLVEDKASDLNQYGLAEPALQVAITEKDNKSQKLLVGDETPTSGGAFARLDGDPRVFTIASYTKSSIDKSVNDLRDKRLLTVDPDKVSRVELNANKQDVEFGRNKDQWQILKPKPLRADAFQVDELVRKLSDAQMEISSDSDAKKTAAGFASGTPVATAKLTTDSGTQELQVRKNKDDYYAKSSVVDGVYKVTSAVGEGVNKKLDDFRNKKVFDFGFNDPNKVEIHDGSKAYFLTKGGQDWWGTDGKKLDAGSVDSLVSKLRDLQASKFVESGFTTPVIEMTVASNDSKRTEKVLISKSGGSYVAKRENEPSLYALDSSAVEELQKSAGEIKPAAAPATKK